MEYRDERDALRRRVETLEEDLAEANERASKQAGLDDRAPRLAHLERRFESARRELDEMRRELDDLRRAEPEPARGGGTVLRPEPQAPARIPKWRGRAGLLVMSAAVGASALGIVSVRQRATPAPRREPDAPSRLPVEAPRTELDFAPGILYPMLARDASGASVDPIVWGRSGGVSCLLRVDGHTGRRAWMVCPYGPPNGGPWADDQNRSALVDDTVLVALYRSLDAFDAKTGEKRWSARLDEGVVDFCRGADGVVYLAEDHGAGDYAIGLAKGDLTRARRPASCSMLQTNGGSPWVTWGEDVQSFGGRFEVDGMVVASRIHHAGRTIALGYARPGPHVPVAASVDARGTILWKRALPPPELGAADTDAPQLAVLDDHHLCATYPGARDPFQLRLGCWDPATGATAWDRPVADPLPRAILVAGPYLVVRSDRPRGGTVWAFLDLATGAPCLTL